MTKNQLILDVGTLIRPYRWFTSLNKDAILDRTVTFIAYVYPLTTLPQLLNIWVDKNAAGVSLLTWTLYFILTIPLLLYAIKIKNKRLAMMWFLWSIIYVAVILGVILYG